MPKFQQTEEMIIPFNEELVFEISPKLNYDHHRQCKHNQKQIDRIVERQENLNLKDDFMNLDELKEKQKILDIRKETEKRENMRIVA